MRAASWRTELVPWITKSFGSFRADADMLIIRLSVEGPRRLSFSRLPGERKSSRTSNNLKLPQLTVVNGVRVNDCR